MNESHWVKEAEAALAASAETDAAGDTSGAAWQLAEVQVYATLSVTERLEQVVDRLELVARELRSQGRT